MKEVSCRALDPIFKACRLKDIPIEKLTALLPYGEGYLFKASNRIDWDEWATVLNAFEKEFGGPDAIAALAESDTWVQISTGFYAGKFLKWALSTVTSPRQLYWLSYRYLGPEIFRNVRSEFEDLGAGKIRIRLIAPDDAKGCAAFFNMCGVNYEQMPMILGLPRARIEGKFGPHFGDYTVTMPASLTLWSRAYRGLKWIFTGGQASFDELNQRLTELQEINRTLEQRVEERTAKLTQAIQEQLAAEKKLRESDLAVTAAVQAMFLPREERSRATALSVTGLYFPATVCGGDWWWHDQLPDGRMRVLLGDVTGHGPGPAMVTAALANAYRILSQLPGATGLSEIIHELNRNLLAVCKGKYFVTFSAVELDPKRGEGRFWSAAAPPALLLTRGGEPQPLQGRGTPLGMEPFELGEEKFLLTPGSRVLLFTDGLFDIPTGKERTYGLKDLFREMEKLSAEPSPLVVERLGQLVHPARSRPEGLSDDVTFVLCDTAGTTVHSSRSGER